MSHHRFYSQILDEVGLLESAPTPTGFPGQLLANRHLCDVLQARGYEAHYDEQMHGHDSVIWPGVLAEGLIALKLRTGSAATSKARRVLPLPPALVRVIRWRSALRPSPTCRCASGKFWFLFHWLACWPALAAALRVGFMTAVPVRSVLEASKAI